MRIFGLDFTSRPTPKKPITCAVCEIENKKLSVLSFLAINDFNSFENFCEAGGAWIAGMDFPFGMPHKLIDDLQYPKAWERYVAKFGSMSRKNFVDLLTDYKSKQPKGSKEHRRITDKKAGSLSPMKLYGVPVGKMFFEGAPRLARSGASILPFVKRSKERIIIEAYPGLVARKAIGRRSYKTDDKRKQSAEQTSARSEIVNWLYGRCASSYSMNIELRNELANMAIIDPSGDVLDSVLCAIQAAWAFLKRHNGYGIPSGVDSLEGWIIDPHLIVCEAGAPHKERVNSNEYRRGNCIK
jgi:hypothetical protein